MIDLVAAKKIATDTEREFPIDIVMDAGKEWVICFYTGEPPIPDVLPLAVSKDDGNTRYIYLPDDENFEYLEKAKIIESNYE